MSPQSRRDAVHVVSVQLAVLNELHSKAQTRRELAVIEHEIEQAKQQLKQLREMKR
jgi:hypothetical protein